MRVLLIRFSSLGDILLQTSFASWLKSQYPSARISFLTLKGSEALLADHPHIDEVLVYQKERGLTDFKKLFTFARSVLAPKSFDLVVDLHGTNRSFLTRCFLPGVLALSMDKRRLERFLLVKTKLDLLKGEKTLHDRNLIDLAWAFGREYSQEELLAFIQRDFPSHRSLTSSAFAKRKKTDERLVVLAPGASFAPKRWPLENFVALAKKMMEQTELKVSIIGGPEDDFQGKFEELEASYPGRLKNLQGKLSLSDSMEMVSRSSLVVGNDSLIGHVAESCSVPSFAIFGPTSESFGFTPRLEQSKSFSVEGLWCRPCSTTGSKKCFRKEQYCMKGVTPELVFSAIAERFKVGRDAI